MECPKEPNMAGHYTDLKISQNATTVQIKKAYRKMVLIHHPDKKTPGQTVDASDFSRVQEAYETIGDFSKRTRYDGQYGKIQSQWMTYRRALEQWRQAELQRTRQKMKSGRERERQLNAAKDAGERKRQEQENRGKGEEKEKRDRADKEEHAEEGSRQAADRARAELEKAALARLRSLKEAEADARSAAVFERAKQWQTHKAQERLAAQASEHEAITETEAFKNVSCFLYWMLEWLLSG